MQLLSSPMKLISRPAAAAVALFAAATSFAELPATDENARSLAAAESAFAGESVAKGMRTAFLNVLADDSIVFQPGPQNGRKVWEAAKDSEGVLQWQPVLAVVATSGDFGYTTGPWTFKKNAAEKGAAAFGQFVSIWRREAGKWKLLFDIGTDNPAPAAPAPTLQCKDNRSPNESTSSARESFFRNDRAYAAAPERKFSAVAADDVRLYPPQKSPVIGRAAAAAVLNEVTSNVTLGEPKGDVSRSGDLGFAWGEYAAKGKADRPAEETGYYLRIWRKNEAREWKLVLDLLHPR
jgi:ketosteroid isomerase-like protein